MYLCGTPLASREENAAPLEGHTTIARRRRAGTSLNSIAVRFAGSVCMRVFCVTPLALEPRPPASPDAGSGEMETDEGDEGAAPRTKAGAAATRPELSGLGPRRLVSGRGRGWAWQWRAVVTACRAQCSLRHCIVPARSTGTARPCAAATRPPPSPGSALARRLTPCHGRAPDADRRGARPLTLFPVPCGPAPAVPVPCDPGAGSDAAAAVAYGAAATCVYPGGYAGGRAGCAKAGAQEALFGGTTPVAPGTGNETARVASQSAPAAAASLFAAPDAGARAELRRPGNRRWRTERRRDLASRCGRAARGRRAAGCQGGRTA